MEEFNERMTRGNDRVLIVRASYPEAIPDKNIVKGDPYPLADRDVRFYAMRSWAADAEGFFEKSSGASGGITVRSPPRDHEAEVEIARADTLDFENDTTLFCRVDVLTAANDWWTIAKGSIYVELAGGT